MFVELKNNELIYTFRSVMDKDEDGKHVLYPVHVDFIKQSKLLQSFVLSLWQCFKDLDMLPDDLQDNNYDTVDFELMWQEHSQCMSHLLNMETSEQKLVMQHYEQLLSEHSSHMLRCSLKFIYQLYQLQHQHNIEDNFLRACSLHFVNVDFKSLEHVEHLLTQNNVKMIVDCMGGLENMLRDFDMYKNFSKSYIYMNIEDNLLFSFFILLYTKLMWTFKREFVVNQCKRDTGCPNGRVPAEYEQDVNDKTQKILQSST